ncbi:MAG: redoxin domain-containing protein [Rhodanobacteraceae bacterium]|nr:redoxin domain-containing protein [Rhodanobacteraceae bacterium]
MALPWRTSAWLNTSAPVDLEAQRGHVVVACAFQMLCPGCVALAIPQMKAVHELFSPQGVIVVGLHTVFEHHDAMTVTALRAFVHEYGIRFPVGVDMPAADGGPIPQTMAAYRMQGTPTLLLIDRSGQLRRQVFGHIPDLHLGAEIMRLVERQ